MPHIVPMLQYPDAPAALAMLTDVLGLPEAPEHRIEEDGVITHAQLGEGAVRLFVASVWEAGGFAAPDPSRPSTVVWFQTPDVAAARERALTYGGDISELQPGPTGELFRWTDPQGQRWLIAAE